MNAIVDICFVLIHFRYANQYYRSSIVRYVVSTIILMLRCLQFSSIRHGYRVIDYMQGKYSTIVFAV